MQFDFVLIMPYSFIGDKLIPGHKKDFYMLRDRLKESGNSVKMLYSKANDLYDSKGERVDISLKNILHNSAYRNSIIIIGPAHNFRATLFARKRRKVYYYVFDSMLKTSIFAFLNNYIYFYRVIYALIIEILLKNHDILVSSLEEYTWFSSSGRLNACTYLLTPLPDSGMNSKALNKDKCSNVILFYNPTGNGLRLAKELIEKLSLSDLDIEVIVTGSACEYIKSSLTFSSRIKFMKYVENISELISNCDLVVLTDMEGSGFCNRALQVRNNNVPLLCTLSSVRGTSLLLDRGVHIFQTSEIGFEQISKIINSENDFDNSLVNRSILRSLDDIDYFMRTAQYDASYHV